MIFIKRRVPEETKVYCNKCGNLLSAEDDFCTVCGTKVNYAETKGSSAGSENIEYTERTEEKGNPEKPENPGLPENRQVQQNGVPQYVIIDKHFMKKIVFLILVIIVFMLSKAEVIEIGIFGSITMDDIARGAEVLRYLDKDISEGFQFFYWPFKIGIWLYFGAALLAFLKKEGVALFCTWIGFLCNACLALCLWMIEVESEGIGVFKMLTEAAWGYAIMNIVLFIYAHSLAATTDSEYLKS